MFKHKKFQAALVASLAALLGGYGSGLAETGDFVAALAMVPWTLVVAPWVVAIGGQGLADIGKEAAKAEKGQ